MLPFQGSDPSSNLGGGVMLLLSYNIIERFKKLRLIYFCMSKENYILRNKNLMSMSDIKLRIDNYPSRDISDNFSTCLCEGAAKFLIEKYNSPKVKDEIEQLKYLNDLINQRKLKSSEIDSINKQYWLEMSSRRETQAISKVREQDILQKKKAYDNNYFRSYIDSTF